MDSTEPLKENSDAPKSTAIEAIVKPARRFAISWFLVSVAAVCVGVFIILQKMGLLTKAATTSELVHVGGAYAPKVAEGEWWRLVTALFVHASVGHLVANLIGLAQFFRMRKIFRERQLVLIYFASGIAGGVLGLYQHPFQVSVGASGAILGLFGAAIGEWLSHVRREGAAALKGGKVYSLIIAFSILVPTLLSQDIHADWAGHIGGTIVGFILGIVAKETQDRAWRFEMASGVALATLFFLALQIPPLPDVLGIVARTVDTFKVVEAANKRNQEPPASIEKVRAQEKLIIEEELKPIQKAMEEISSIESAVKEDKNLNGPVANLKTLAVGMSAVCRLRLAENSLVGNRFQLKIDWDTKKVSAEQAYQSIMGQWIPGSKEAEKKYLPQIATLDTVIGKPISEPLKTVLAKQRDQLLNQAAGFLSAEIADSLRSDVHHFVETVGARNQTEDSLTSAGQFLKGDFNSHIGLAQKQIDEFVQNGGTSTPGLEKQMTSFRVAYSTLSLFVLDIKIRNRFAKGVLINLRSRKPDRATASSFVSAAILPLIGEFAKVDPRAPASKDPDNGFDRAVLKLRDSRRTVLNSLVAALKTKNQKKTQAALLDWQKINSSPLGVSVLNAANHVIQVIDHPK